MSGLGSGTTVAVGDSTGDADGEPIGASVGTVVASGDPVGSADASGVSDTTSGASNPLSHLANQPKRLNPSNFSPTLACKFRDVASSSFIASSTASCVSPVTCSLIFSNFLILFLGL